MSNSKKVWVVLGPAGQIAPFYGYAFTRKALKYEFERNGWKMHPGMRIVRATVTFG